MRSGNGNASGEGKGVKLEWRGVLGWADEDARWAANGIAIRRVTVGGDTLQANQTQKFTHYNDRQGIVVSVLFYEI